MTVYEGVASSFTDAHADDGAMVLADGALLSPEPSLKLRNHSPTGFSWGYMGSGPSQLSLALLLHALADERRAILLYQSFKFQVVSRWPQQDGWLITTKEIESICNGLDPL